MKRTISFLASALFVFVFVNAAFAQADNTQAVNISFPEAAVLHVSDDPGTLTLTSLTVDGTGGTWAPATDATTYLYQVNNAGTVGAPLTITAEGVFSEDLSAKGLTLTLTPTMEIGSSGSGQAATLSTTGSHSLITGVQKGFSSWNLSYQLSATEQAEAATSITGTVTFTVTGL